MDNVYNVRIPHQYDLEKPDAVLNLASATGSAHRLYVWQARGSRRWIRIGETLQAPDHPEFPHGHALFLAADRDTVIPLYTTQVLPTTWNVAVHYNEGGEQKVYSFMTKEDALKFQSFVTGYDVVQYFHDIEIIAVHHHEKLPWYKPWKKVASKPELTGRGEIQIWQRKVSPSAMSPSGSSAVGRNDGNSLTSGVKRVPTIGTVSRQADAVTIVTTTEGRQLAIGTRPEPPLLVAFLRHNGEHIMLKVDLSKLNPAIERTLLVLSPRSSMPFTVSRVTATDQRLGNLNICCFGILSGKNTGDKLRCEFLTLETQCNWRDPARLDPTGKYRDPKLTRRKRDGAEAIVGAMFEPLKLYEIEELGVAHGVNGAVWRNEIVSSPQDSLDVPSPSSSSMRSNALPPTRRRRSMESARGPAELASPVEMDEVSELQAIPARVARVEIDSTPHRQSRATSYSEW